MLQIESINPTGMFSFGESEDVSLSFSGLVHLQGINKDKGGSNGAGKSSLFNALCEILFGDNPTGVSGDGVINRLWKQGYGGRVVFANKGQRYRVTYCRKFKAGSYPADNNNHADYKGSTLFFEQYVDGIWLDKREASMSATRQSILTALGMTYSQFLAVSYLSPRVGSVLLRGANKDKLDVLSGLVGLHEWDAILDKIREAKRSANAKVQELNQKKAYHEGQVSVLTGQIALVPDVVQKQDGLIVLQQALTAKRDATKQTLVEAQEVYNKAKLNIDAVYAKLQGSDVFKAATDAGNKVTELEQARLALETDSVSKQNGGLSKYLDAVSVAQTELTAATRALIQASASVDLFEKENTLMGVDKCPTCGSKITKASQARMAKGLKTAQSAAKGAKAVVDEKQVVLSQAESALGQARLQVQAALVEDRLVLEAGISEAKEIAAKALSDYQLSVAEYELLRQELLQFGNNQNLIQGSLVTVEAELSACNVELSGLEATKARLATLQESLASQAAEVTKLDTDIQQVGVEADHLAWFITNIPYIKLHKLSVALEDLSALTNAYLASMGDTVRVEISSFKEKKHTAKDDRKSLADLLKSEISVKAIDGVKEIDTRLYSDGETARITNALVRGLHALAAKAGQGCNVILLDEVFSYVDAENSQKIADSFASYGQNHIALVTDNSGLANNLINFSNTWVVEKTNGLSTLKAN